MRRLIGISLLMLANVILLAHIFIPHSHSPESHKHEHTACMHVHEHHHHAIEAEKGLDFTHLFCDIEHAEEDFTFQVFSSALDLNSFANSIVYYTLFHNVSNIDAIDYTSNLISFYKIPIYHSPHLIRTGEKAPPLYLA